MTPVEKLELTIEQEKAFASFERAYKKCKKAGIEFYTVLESVYALNGKHLIRVHDEIDKGDVNTAELNNPNLFDPGFAGWADDKHFAEVDDT